MRDYFSGTYEESRKKFLNLVKNGIISSFQIDKDLFTDYAFFESKKKKNIVILVSWTHGIEWYIWSAVQQLFIEKYFPKINDETSVVMIHALNPYGMKHFKRINKNNIDLNRAFLKNLEEYTENDEETKKIFDKISAKLIPNRKRKSHLFEIIAFYLNSVYFILKYWLKKVKQVAGIKWQYHNSKSLQYGGLVNNQKEKEVVLYQDFLNKISKKFNNLIVIDLHSGMPRKTLYIIEHEESSDEFKKWKKVTNKDSKIKKIVSLRKQFSPIRKWSLAGYTVKNSFAKNNYGIVVDYLSKTSPMKAAFNVGAEFHSHHYGTKNQNIELKIKKNFNKMMTCHWNKKLKKKIIKESEFFFNRLLNVFELEKWKEKI